MSPFKTMSVDDEPSAHQALKVLLKNTVDVEISATFTSPQYALAALRAERYELMFLDISMPEMTGLELLRSLDAPPVTVLMTAHVEHALTAFELGVRDYLLKPVAVHRLALCLENIRPLLLAGRANSSSRAPAVLAIKCGTLHRLVDPLRTLRVEGAGNFSTVYVEHETVFASESMKDLERRLAPCGFVRIHKSHFVNIRYLRAISGTEATLEGGVTLPIGRAYRVALIDAVKETQASI
jgi:two-component system LytT family response regulator